MDLSTFVRDDYVQLAVIVSGLLTLLVLLVQGVRFIVIPVVSVFRNGLVKARSIAREKFTRDVEISTSNPSFLTTKLAYHILRVLWSMFGMVLGGFMVIAACFLYVPGYVAGAGHLLIGEESRDLVFNISNAFVSIASLFLIMNFASALRFTGAVQRKLRISERS
jgi:hypothetical protein